MNADPFNRQQIFKQLRELGAQTTKPQSWDTGELPDPMMSTMPYRDTTPAPPGWSERSPSGMVNPDTGADAMPGTGDGVYYTDAPTPGQRGNPENGTWDMVTDREPVYEYNGMRIVGDLKWAPSWPQDLQPVDYIDVPRSGTEWRMS